MKTKDVRQWRHDEGSVRKPRMKDREMGMIRRKRVVCEEGMVGNGNDKEAVRYTVDMLHTD